MNPLIPIAFSLLSVSSDTERETNEPHIFLRNDVPIDMIAEVSRKDCGRNTLIYKDVIASDGASRGFFVTVSQADSLIDIVDAGPWGNEGIIDNFYFTDNKNETVTPVFILGDSNPEFTSAPEGGLIIELTDRIEIVLTDEANKTMQYTVRDNQIKLKVDETGHFLLQSIRPKPNDLSELFNHVKVYDIRDDSVETSLDSNTFTLLMLELFPLPGK